MYAEDTAQARTIAGKIEEDPRWELIAVCATLADLNFVLDRAPVDVLLLMATPQTDEGVLTAIRERTRSAHIPVWVQSCFGEQFKAPNGLLLANRTPRLAPGNGKGVFWAPLPPMPQLDLGCRTAKDIMGAQEYGRHNGREGFDDVRGCNTLV
jgi:hypothetical protein